ncbi:MAG TPA: hypothetical protein VNZ44_19265 [Pyrinomonadaceae bacterium]|nr:hypothetical protein [Pyrinomonadaceae bacterium]
MNGWMKRRIERSRARCDRPATNAKPERTQEPTKQAAAQSAQSEQQTASS